MTNTDPGAPQYEYDWQNPDHKTFDFGRVLGRSFSGIFANVKPIIIALAVILFFTTIMSIYSSDRLSSVIGSGNPEEALANLSFWFWTFAAAIPALFFSLWLQLIVVETSYADFVKSAQPQSPLTSSLKYVLPMFVVAFIYAFVCLLGFYALLIGFLFVWPGWALAGPILVHEKKGIFGSLSEAWRLSKGSKRWIFLLMIILALIGGVVYSVMSGIATVATGVNIFSGDPTATLSMSTGTQIIFNVLVGVGGYFSYVLFASGLTAAYVEVKTLKDGAPNVGEIFS